MIVHVGYLKKCRIAMGRMGGRFDVCCLAFVVCCLAFGVWRLAFGVCLHSHSLSHFKTKTLCLRVFVFLCFKTFLTFFEPSCFLPLRLCSFASFA